MKTYLEPTEVKPLEKAATCVRDLLLIRLLWHLGCRISEALAIVVQDIDFQQGTVTIEHLKTGLKLTCPRCNARLGRSHCFCPKCGAKVEEAVARRRKAGSHHCASGGPSSRGGGPGGLRLPGVVA